MYIVVDNQTGEIKAQTQNITKALGIAQALIDMYTWIDKRTFEVEVA
jgi:hypothetical protein